MINTPILFLIFNRPDTTARVFAAIREAKPRQLYIAADGPRLERAGENEITEAVLKIVSRVDWDCQVHTLYRQKNLGCGAAVSSAINWFFSQVEKGIILEDDTLPNQSFFQFCELMLERFKDDARIAHINGSNFQLGKTWGKASYYFSKYPEIWGWATWRRAWQQYEYKMDSFPEEASNSKFWARFSGPKETEYWLDIFQKMHDGFKKNKNALDTWDYQWIYTCLKYGWLSITPNVNLISNIGFGDSATHTKAESLVSNLPNFELNEIYHPNKIKVYKGADMRLFNIYFNPPQRLINIVRNLIYKIFSPTAISKVRLLRRKYFPNLK